MAGESRGKKQVHYIAPNNDFKGLASGLTILTLFIIFWYHALFQINLTNATWFDIIGTFVILEFLYTGLFITCHDAMHGVVSCHVSCLIMS